MAAKKGAKKSAAKKRPKRSNPSHSSHSSHSSGGSHGTLVPRGMMLVPTGAGARTNPRKKGKGRRPHRRNPAGEHLKNAAAAVGFGAVAATVGMLGGWAVSKANLKNKWANVALNVATGALSGGGLGMVDRTAGTIVAHNYLVAAGQWVGAHDGGDVAPQARSGVSPGMFAHTHATNGLGDEQPDPEAITRALPAPQLSSYQRFDGLGSPLDHLGSPLDHLGAVLADDVGGDDVEGYAHLDGILADNLGEEVEALDAVMADDIGMDDVGDDLDGMDDLGFIPG